MEELMGRLERSLSTGFGNSCWGGGTTVCYQTKGNFLCKIRLRIWVGRGQANNMRHTYDLLLLGKGYPTTLSMNVSATCFMCPFSRNMAWKPFVDMVQCVRQTVISCLLSRWKHKLNYCFLCM